MLFLVISTPRPERPSEWAAKRTTFWPWLATQEEKGLCKWGYARAGRGAVALFDEEQVWGRSTKLDLGYKLDASISFGPMISELSSLK